MNKPEADAECEAQRRRQARLHVTLSSALALAVGAIWWFQHQVRVAARVSAGPAAVRGQPIQPVASPPAPTNAAPAGKVRGSFAKRLVAHTAKLDALAEEEPQAEEDDPVLRDVSAAPLTVPGYTAVGFAALGGYKFNLTPDVLDGAANPDEAKRKTLAQIPPGVLALDGTKAAIRGFMLPLQMKEGRCVLFMLLPNQSLCCYGRMPRINEWIIVRADHLNLKPVMDRPVVVCGGLRVGDQREGGHLVALYAVDADKVFAAEDVPAAPGRKSVVTPDKPQ
jgi:hypothetical protein